MMAAANTPPALLPCDASNIPEQLRKANRWAPWAAPWDEEKEKYGKVPHRADRVTSGLSNGSPAGWVSFDKALAAYHNNPELFAGVGYLMTGAHGVVGVDLDNCVKDGVIEPWAAEIIAKLDSYTEISPSGTGLHVMLAGDLESDWSVKLGDKKDKQPGIDVYGGKPRFLTVTGAHVPGSPRDLRPSQKALVALESKYRKSAPASNLAVLPPPDTYGMELPDLRELDLPDFVVEFLYEGLPHGSDRSNALIRVSTALAAAGLSAEMAFAVMVDNEHTMEAALGKRQYDDTRAREYLWRHQARRGTEIVETNRRDMFDALDEPVVHPAVAEDDIAALLGEGSIEDDFSVLDDDAPAASRDLSPVGLKRRFQFESLSAFLNRPPPKWIVKGVLPQAALAVIFGDSGSGKTFFALDMAISVATGRPWRDTPVAAGGVAYVVAEGAGGFVDRAFAYCHQHGLAAGEFPLHILADQPNLMQKPDVDDLIAELKLCGPLSVIYLDTYARVMGEGNENEAKDVNKIVRHCARLHKATGAIVVLIHHSGKDTTKGARGSGALRAAADAEIEVKKGGSFRTATITKMKDGSDDAQFKFKLQSVVIGIDEDGDDRTSCIVEHLPDSTPAAVEERKPRGTQQKHIWELLQTYYPDEEVSEAEFLEFAKDHATSANDPNWKKKIQDAVSGLANAEFISVVSGYIRVNNNV